MAQQIIKKTRKKCNECSSDLECEIQKIYPTIEELSTVNNSIKCSEENCNEVFTSSSNLNLHLYKRHMKKDAMDFTSNLMNKQFHCPLNDCCYHDTQYFKNKKLLKQHYTKVHMPKTYICEICNEGFSTKLYKNLHVEYCGVKFKCKDCPITYPKYESLITHARRKSHTIYEKSSYKIIKPKTTVILSKSEGNLMKTFKPILPKFNISVSSEILSNNPKNKIDCGVQTENSSRKFKSKFTDVNRKKTTKQTQTLSKLKSSSTETQTIGDFHRSQSSTQTSNTVLDMNEFLDNEVIQNSSSTQTMNDIIYSSSTNTHDSIQTDTTDLLDNFDSNFFNCNMETQTDFMFDDELLKYCDYYGNNMYTQTCEEILNEMAFNTIETQTVNEMLTSVESQTLMSQIKKPQLNSNDTIHVETQTDVEFNQILEDVINA